MRIALFVAATCAFVAIVGSARSSARPPPAVASSYYVVRPDPRLCPSPLCGGYWVSLANHARTRCHDGLLRPRCYVAVATDPRGRPTGVPGNALARAVLGSQTFEGFGDLGVLAVADAWAPVTPTQPAGRFFRIRDTGIRCIRAPCFSLRVGRLNSSAHTSLVSSLDLGPARGRVTRHHAEIALGEFYGLFAAGHIIVTADGGRLLRATQVYLRGLPPRA
jgi:hypothetical protein